MKSDSIQKLKEKIKELCENQKFIHYRWFFRYHLEIVEKISLELCDVYKNADRKLVLMMVWMHDYGKIVNFNDQYVETLGSGLEFLIKLGFDREISQKAIDCIEIIDKKENIETAQIEVQIISSADGAAHLVGPFFYLWWYENYKKEFEVLMNDNKEKLLKDWKRKIVIPEVKKSFENRHDFLLEQCGNFPEKFLL